MNPVWLIISVLIIAPGLAYAVPGTIEVDLDGTLVELNYDAEGVEVTGATANIEHTSLILEVTVSDNPGILELTLEKSFFDSGPDDSFIILADSDEVISTETPVDDTRVLRIELPTGTDEVEIIGTAFGSADTTAPPTDESNESDMVQDTDTADTDESNVTPVQESNVSDEPVDASVQESDIICGAGTVLVDGLCVLDAIEPDFTQNESDTICGAGTVLVDGLCVLDTAMEPDSMQDESDTICGAGTVLVDGLCVLDAIEEQDTMPVESDIVCGAGTILRDGLCVATAKPVGSGKDFVMGIVVALVIAFVVMIILKLIGIAGKSQAPVRSSS